jgi:hypothetical protein
MPTHLCPSIELTSMQRVNTPQFLDMINQNCVISEVLPHCHNTYIHVSEKSAHFLNISAEKINRAMRVHFSPHGTATQRKFSPPFLNFTTLTPELPLLLAQCPSGTQMPSKRFHTFEARFLPQNGRCVFSNLAKKRLVFSTPGPLCTPIGRNPLALIRRPCRLCNGPTLAIHLAGKVVSRNCLMGKFPAYQGRGCW